MIKISIGSVAAMLLTTTGFAAPALSQTASSPATTPPASAETAVAPSPTASPVAATEAPAAPTAAAPQSVGSGDIIVTAQRRSERLRDVPLTVIAQTGENLAQAGVTNLKELSIVAPGLAFTSQGPFAEPNIRGVSTTLSLAGAESPIAIYVDGVYQPNQIGNLFDLPDVQQVEVLKGPQGTLFGRNATGGAISIHTQDPQYKFSGNFNVSDGAFYGNNVETSNHVIAKGFITAPIIADKLAVSLSGSYENANGYLTDGVNGGNTGRISSWTVRGKVLFEPVDGVKFLLTGYAGHRYDAASSVAATTGISVATQYPDAILPNKPWTVASELKGSVQPVITNSRGGSLKADFKIGDLGTLSSLTAYSYTDGTVQSEVDGAYAPSCVAAFACITPYFVDFGPSKTFQQELTFASRDFGPFRFIAGGFFYHDKSGISTAVNDPLVGGVPIGQQPYSGTAPYYESSIVRTKSYAGFGELTWNITDRLHAIGGVRYSWEQKKGVGSILGATPTSFGGDPVFHSTTPRASLRYDITSHANVYATYRKGFKSGVLNSLSLTADVAKPETLNSYEVGMKYGTSRFSLDLSAFYYDYKNLQIQFFEGLASVIGNAPSARIYGFDFDGNAKITSDLSLRLAGSYVPHAKYKEYTNGVGFVFPLTPFGLQQVTVDASGQRILKTPKFTGNASLNYKRETAMGTIDASTTLYYSSQYKWNLVDRVFTRRYATLSAQIGVTPVGSNFRIGLYGKNLTNKAYATATTLSAEGDTYAYAPPREIGVSVGYKF